MQKVTFWHTTCIINNWIGVFHSSKFYFTDTYNHKDNQMLSNGFLSCFQFDSRLLLLLISLLLLLFSQDNIHHRYRRIFQLEGQVRTEKTLSNTRKKTFIVFWRNICVHMISRITWPKEQSRLPRHRAHLPLRHLIDR